MSKKRTAEYKPLLFTTTLRNPSRMKDYIDVLIRFNERILNNDLISEIVEILVANKLYRPNYISKNISLKVKYLSDKTFSKSETQLIIENSPQKHKEAGFEKGWPSRFDTWYKFMKELGFVYYELGKPIEVSETGFMLSNSIKEGYEHLENQVFSNAFAKYQRNNPFRRVNNNNKPLILLLKTIIELKSKFPSSAGISRKEIPLLLVWKNDNVHELVAKIISIRELYGFRPSSEVIYDICKDIQGISESEEKRFKIDNILEEMPDDFIRKMRLTGLISLRGNGRFVDINSLEQPKIEYIIKNYSTVLSFSIEHDFFDYMKKVDPEIVSSERVLTFSDDIKTQLFKKWVDTFSLEIITKEILILNNSRLSSKHDVFKYIDEPVRLEFLTALALQKKYSEIIIKPNYVIDDEGIPYTHAPGGNADIECLDFSGNILFEVTMLTGAQQNIREMNSIWRHLRDKVDNYPDSFSVLVAPTIHEDTEKYARFIKSEDGLDVKTYDIAKFINTLPDKDNIRDFKA